MDLSRVRKGEWVAAGAAIMLFGSMFLRWYDFEVVQGSSLLGRLYLFENGGNAWHTLGVIPILLALIAFATVWVAVLRLTESEWEPARPPGAVVCMLGGLAALLVAARIAFPPDSLNRLEGYTFAASLKAGVFVALAAACGIGLGGWLAMREEGVSLGDLSRRGGVAG